MARIAVGHLPDIVREYIATVLEPAGSRAGGALPMILGFAKVWIPNQVIPKMITDKKAVLESLYILDAQGMVDVDAVIEALSPVLEENPFVWQGYRFDKGDLEKMREIASRYVGKEHQYG